MPSAAARRRQPDGFVRPYRPCPRDFRETFLVLGWDRAIEEHYRTNWRCIRRWIEECGGIELRMARFALAGAKTGGKLRCAVPLEAVAA
jgi:hypothetical protein